jgi:hypothetical protein
MDSNVSRENEIEWWELFFIPFPSKSMELRCVSPRITTTANILPLILLLSSIFAFSYLLLTNENYLKRNLESAKARITDNEQYRVFELTEEANCQILRNPGVRLIIAMRITLKYSLSLLCTICLFGVGIVLFSGRWNKFKEYWFLVSSSLGVLLLNSLILFLLRWSLLLIDDNISLTLVMQDTDISNILYKLAKQVDLFNLWFLFLLSTRLERVFNETRLVLFLVFMLTFIIIIISFSLLGIDYFLIV